MDDYGMQDNKYVLKLIALEINKNNDFVNCLCKTQLNFNIDDFNSSNDKVIYLNKLRWNIVSLPDLIEINKWINFTYCIFEDSDALKICYVKRGQIELFGIDEQIYNGREYTQYLPFGEYLKNESSKECYDFYMSYMSDAVRMDDDTFGEGFNEYYDEISKRTKNYFNIICNSFDIAVWTEIF